MSISPQDGVSVTGQTVVTGMGTASVLAATTANTASPVNTVAPALSGTTTVGSTITCSSGTWTGADSYIYFWTLEGVILPWATATTIVAQASWVGATLVCIVTAINVYGRTEANSDALVVTA